MKLCCAERSCTGSRSSTALRPTAPRRRHAQVRPKEVAQPPSRERVRCDAVSCKEPRTRTVRWVYCDVCGRWLHFVCANIRRKLIHLCYMPRPV